jgi:hypothetical protein
MSRPTRRLAATALSLSAVFAPLSGQTAIAVDDGGADTASPVPSFAQPASLLSYAVELSTLRATPLGLTDAAPFVQTDAALRNPLSGSLRSDSDVFLWNYVAMLYAQQQTSPFDLEDTRLATVVTLPPVSPVPLPTMEWLLIIVALGMVGARLVLPAERVPRDSTQGESPDADLGGMRTA